MTLPPLHSADPTGFYDPDVFPEEEVPVVPRVDGDGTLLPLPIKCREGRCGDAIERFLDDGHLITEEGRRQSAFIAACDMAARGFPQAEAERRIVERLREGGPGWSGLSDRDLEDIPRQIANAYREPRWPFDREDESCLISAKASFTVTRESRKSCRVVVEAGSQPIIDVINPAKASQRKTFLQSCQEGLPDTEETAGLLVDLEAELIRIGSGGACPNAESHEDDDAPEITNATEIDDSHTIRPDVFVPVSGERLVFGVTIEERHLVDGETFIGTRTYSREFPSGEKRCEVSPEFIAVGDARFFFSPRPQRAGPADQKESLTGWSPADRHRWLTEDSPPQDVRALCDDIYAVIDRFVEFTPAELDREFKLLLMVFVIYTYAYARFTVAPYLCFTGPKGSGKTTAVSVLKQLVFGPIPVSAASDAYLFRRLDKFGGTLLYDEAEDLEIAMEEASDKWKMLLSGTKTGSPVGRCVGEEHRTKAFHVFGPKVLAGTKTLPDTLLSRCISTVMMRCRPDSQRADDKPDSAENHDLFQRLRDRLYRFWLDHGGSLISLPSPKDVCPRGLQAREREVWLPLLQMAAILENLGAAPGLLADLKRLASDPGRVPDMASASGLNPLQRDCLHAMAALHPGDHAPKAKFPTPTQVLEEMRRESPQSYNLHKPETISRTLASFHIETTKSDGRRILFVQHAKLMDLFERYGMKPDAPEASQVPPEGDREPPTPATGSPTPTTGSVPAPTGTVDRDGCDPAKTSEKGPKTANRDGRDGSPEGVPGEKKMKRAIPIRRPGA